MRPIARTVTRWEWVLLILLLPVLLFPTGWRSLAVFILPGLFLVRWLGCRRPFPATSYDVAFLGLLTMVLVSLGVTFDITLSFYKIVGILLGLTLFYSAVAYTRRHPHGLWHVLALFLTIGVGMAGIGLVGTQWPAPFTFLNQWQRILPAAMRQIPGTVHGFINANEMAGTLAWIVPVAVALTVGLGRYFWQKRKWLLLLCGGGTLLTTATFMATLSRGGLLSLAISLLVMVAIPYRWGRWVAVITAVLVGVGGVTYFNLGDLAVGSQTAVGALSLNARLEIWSRAIYGLADFPFTGMSINGFRRVVHTLYPLFLVPPDMDIGHAHNQLLQVGLDVGLPGLIAYVAIWLISVTLLWQSWHRAVSLPHKSVIIGLSGALTAGWVFGIFDAITLGARPGFVWWLLLALIAAVHDSTRGFVPGVEERVALLED